MQIKEAMAEAAKHFAELAERVRGALHNENLADVLAGVAGQCKMASEHPDAEHTMQAVEEAHGTGEKIPPLAEREPELSGKPVDPAQMPFPAFEGSNNGVGGASQQGGG